MINKHTDTTVLNKDIGTTSQCFNTHQGRVNFASGQVDFQLTCPREILGKN